MSRPVLRVALGTALGTVLLAAQPPDAGLEIYWIDVEGGAATLVVTPSRQSILMDAGRERPDERNARRIQDALRDAGVDGIDYFIASHFHGDHVGGLPALAARVPIGRFVDHGDSVEQSTARGLAAWNAYRSVAEGRRRTVAPGDKLPLRGLEFSFVLAGGETLDRPLLPLGPNPHCDRTEIPGLHQGIYPEEGGESARSVGYLVSLGAFQFLNLGDATPNVQYALACPENLLGEVDVYQVPRHGDGVAPELTWALAPAVAVISNGPREGGSAEGFQVVARSPRLEDIWQSHRPPDADGAYRADDDLTANLTAEDDRRGHWIKAAVDPEGRSYSLTNGRNGASRAYLSR